MQSRSKPAWQKALAKERIKALFSEASKNPGKSKRYVELARKTAMRYNIKLTPSQRRKVCRHCYSFLTPKTTRIRTSSKQKSVVVTCLSCKKQNRYPYKREKSSKTKK